MSKKFLEQIPLLRTRQVSLLYLINEAAKLILAMNLDCGCVYPAQCWSLCPSVATEILALHPWLGSSPCRMAVERNNRRHKFLVCYFHDQIPAQMHAHDLLAEIPKEDLSEVRQHLT